MSLKPKGKFRKLTRKQMLARRARKGAATKLQQRKLNKMQEAKRILEQGGDVFDVCSGLDCVLQEGLKIVRDINRILESSGKQLTRRKTRERDVEKGMALDEIAERVFKRVQELTGQKKP